MALPKDELLLLLGNIALGEPKHIADEFARIANMGLPARLCERCEAPMEPELDGYSRVCAECLGEDNHFEMAAREPREDPQTGFLDEWS